MKDDLASLESGRFSVAEKIKNGRVDVTRDWITELKDRIENLKRVIAAMLSGPKGENGSRKLWQAFGKIGRVKYHGCFSSRIAVAGAPALDPSLRTRIFTRGANRYTRLLQ